MRACVCVGVPGAVRGTGRALRVRGVGGPQATCHSEPAPGGQGGSTGSWYVEPLAVRLSVYGVPCFGRHFPRDPSSFRAVNLMKKSAS